MPDCKNDFALWIRMERSQWLLRAKIRKEQGRGREKERENGYKKKKQERAN